LLDQLHLPLRERAAAGKEGDRTTDGPTEGLFWHINAESP
jgi:hypothetical protein